MEAFDPSAYATGLLVVRPGEVLFLPGERAQCNGHQPWQLTTADLPTEVARIGAYTHTWLRGPWEPIELQLTARARTLRESLSRSAAAVR